MHISGNKNIFNIIRRTLNLVDYRLVSHGEKVAFIVLSMLRQEGIHDERYIAKACIIAMLHDIGAIKTEELNSLNDQRELLKFEMSPGKGHSAYGYLFLNSFTSLSGLSDAVLYHHTPYQSLLKTDCKNKDLAAKIFAADRYEVLFSYAKKMHPEKNLNIYRDTIFSGDAIDLIETLQDNLQLREKLASLDYLDELYHLFHAVSFSDEEDMNLLTLLVFLIDFRSPHTVTHTMTTVAISKKLGELLSLPEDTMHSLYLGSLLHDVGKIVTPISILEKPGKLTPEEYTTMKDHVLVTNQILNGCVDKEVLDIAVRHHEKLDGSGYPYGLTERDLTIPQRILAIADITSALIGRRSYKDAMIPETVKKILLSDASKNKLSPPIVSLLLEHYDSIITYVKDASLKPFQSYKNITEQFPVLLQQLPS